MRRHSAAHERNRVRELMDDGGSRPLLGEARDPVAASIARPAENVLKDAAILIERLLDEKRVVDDLELLRLCEARRFFLREAGSRGHRQEDERGENAYRYHQPSTSTSSFEAARVPMVIDSRFGPFNRTESAAVSRSSTSIACPGFR